MNITLTLQDGKRMSADIEDFNSQEFADMLNEEPHKIFAFGNSGVLKHMVRQYQPTDELEKAEDTPQINKL